MNLLVFGDSISWGCDDKENLGWVSHLRKYLEEKKKDIDVYNLSISGDTTEGLLKRFEQEIKARNPEIIMFAIGINDSAIIDKKNYVDFKIFRSYISALIESSKGISEKIIFVGLTRVDESKTNPTPWKGYSYLSSEIKKYDDAIKELCKKSGIDYIDVSSEVLIEDLPDGLHPDANGHKKMFEKIRKSIKF